MLSQFQRTELLLGSDNMEKLRRSRVAVFGVGALDLIDHDTVSLTNLNRQIIATHLTIGRLKTDVMKERLLSICPDLSVTCFPVFALPENLDQFPFSEYDYIVDAVDSVAAKVALAEEAARRGVPIISSMGAGNKLDPSRLRVSDISKTSVCPLARAVRQALKKKGITHLKAVWSDEPPRMPAPLPDGEPLPPGKRSLPGSIMFVPAAAGLLIAAEVIQDLTREGI